MGAWKEETSTRKFKVTPALLADASEPTPRKGLPSASAPPTDSSEQATLRPPKQRVSGRAPRAKKASGGGTPVVEVVTADLRHDPRSEE